MAKKKKFLNNMSKFIYLGIEETTNVYFIVTQVHKNNDWENRVKVGISVDPDKRLKELQTGNPFLLKLWYSFPVSKKSALKIEKDLHNKFRWCRTYGEWFEIKSVIREWIKEHRIVYKRTKEKINDKCCILRKRICQ